jgi:Family of unknown function (DUF6011)
MFSTTIAAVSNETESKAEWVQWLENYTGDSLFFISLKQQLSRGGLSPKQLECVQKQMRKDNEVVNHFSLKNGTIVILTRSVAQRVAAEAGYAGSHRAIEILGVEVETANAYKVRAKLSARRTSHCGICGMVLTDGKSIEMGIGPVCAKKQGIKYNGAATLQELEAKLSVTQEITTWIPRWSVKEEIA